MTPSSPLIPPSMAAPSGAVAPGGAYAVAVALVLALQFGPSLGLVGFVLHGSPAWALIGLARDLIVAVLLLYGLHALLSSARQQRLPASVRWALAFAIACLLLGLLAESNPLVAALNLRRLVFLPLLFVALWLIPWTAVQIRALMRLVLVTCLAVAVIGLAERLADETLWTQGLRIEAYAASNPFDRFGWLPYHDSGRYFTWDLERWGLAPLRRMVSTYLEPTTLAAGLAAGFTLVLAERARGRGSMLAWCLLGVCAAATFAKSFLLFVPLLLMWRALGWPGPAHVASLTLVAALSAAYAVAAGLRDGPFEHIEGLVTGLRFLTEGRWLGIGIGEAGNYANADTDIGAESGLGNALAQVGVVAFMLLAWVRTLAQEALARSAVDADPGGPWIASWLLFWLVSFLFSASSLGVGGNALGFALLALYLHPNRAPWD